jgi:hypothetical protein
MALTVLVIVVAITVGMRTVMVIVVNFRSTYADSDEVAHLYRDDAARDSDLIPPGCEPSSGNGFLALVLGRVNPPFDSKSAAVDVAVGMWTTPLRVVQA